VEVRSGLLAAKQPIERPVVHFGLGARKTAAVIRVSWGNGETAFAFEEPGNQVFTLKQRISW
jgi:hypothetical protein